MIVKLTPGQATKILAKKKTDQYDDLHFSKDSSFGEFLTAN